VRHYVGWAYQIYIVAALCLKGEHHPGQFLSVNSITFTQLAYSVVLAEDTVQIAVGEEDSS